MQILLKLNLMKNRKITHLPYPIYYLSSLFIALLGLVNSCYLSYSHYLNYTDYTYSSFCAISKAINCDTVAQSPWSIFFGVPVAQWGILAYLLYCFVLIFNFKNSRTYRSVWGFLFCIGVVFTFGSIIFAIISATKIHSFCLLCVFSYAINFALLYNSWIVRRRFAVESIMVEVLSCFKGVYVSGWNKIIVCIFFFLGALLIQFTPHYWEYTGLMVTKSLSTGVTDDGNPWIGAENPQVTIEEFADYQCFQCYKLHLLLRRIISEHPKRIRLVHHHYPMDHEVNSLVVPEPFHVGSGRLALIAIAASFQDKFWQMNDALYEMLKEKNKNIKVKELSAKLGIDSEKLLSQSNSDRAHELLYKDIHQGWNYSITGTPAFVINGNVYLGHIPSDVLSEMVR